MRTQLKGLIRLVLQIDRLDNESYFSFVILIFSSRHKSTICFDLDLHDDLVNTVFSKYFTHQSVVRLFCFIPEGFKTSGKFLRQNKCISTVGCIADKCHILIVSKFFPFK